MSFGYKTNIDGVVLKKVIKFQNNVSAKRILNKTKTFYFLVY